MYCAGCGQMITNDETVCSRCGRQTGVSGPANAVHMYEIARTIRKLRQYWFVFACLNVALGVAGLIAVQIGFTHQTGPWEPWPHPPFMEWTYIGGLAWTLLLLRVAMSAFASMALRDQAGRARPATLMAAVFAMTQFPIGLLLGAYTLAKLGGRRGAALDNRLT